MLRRRRGLRRMGRNSVPAATSVKGERVQGTQRNLPQIGTQRRNLRMEPESPSPTRAQKQRRRGTLERVHRDCARGTPKRRGLDGARVSTTARSGHLVKTAVPYRNYEGMLRIPV